VHEGTVQTIPSATDKDGTWPKQGGAASPLQGAPSRRQTLRQRYSHLLPFAIISTSYLLFTITDGAVRMIVLLHAYQKGFSAMEVAVMFAFYELAGVITNLAAGLMGARWGIKTTLLAGLSVQLAGLGMLFGWQVRSAGRSSRALTPHAPKPCLPASPGRRAGQLEQAPGDHLRDGFPGAVWCGQGPHQTGWKDRHQAGHTRREAGEQGGGRPAAPPVRWRAAPGL
jgi:hypothetical protein